MNYPPPYHTEFDEEKIFAAIEAIQHATLLVPSDDGLQVAFTPFLLDREQRVLRGHVAKRNPQSELFDGRVVDVIFHGPHAYISPQLNDNDDVPTWNYVNVHVTGKAVRLEGEVRKWRFLQDIVQVMEKENTNAYFGSQEARLRKLLPGIVVFEISIDALKGRFKLGRNDPAELQQKTFTALRKETPSSLQTWLQSLAPETPAE